jgi:hypothetical protein
MVKENDKRYNEGHGKHSLHLTINEKTYDWHQQYISGAELRQLGHIPNDDDIFLMIKRPWEDELIKDDSIVNLARPEIEHFVSKCKQVKIRIIMNGREKEWDEKTITFEQVVILAFGAYDNNPNKVYTVTYDRGPHQNPAGSMVRGDQVVVKNKMIFNATATDKS